MHKEGYGQYISPTQKAEVVKALKIYSGLTTAAVGDGGNDVGMIQEADLGIGLVGKEGRQASLSSDFSITQFRYLARLLFYHGRLSYNRTASLSQFIAHRGLILAVVQSIFTMLFFFTAIPLFHSFLLMGYGTIFTFAPVFYLVTDTDVKDESVILRYPTLYHSLRKARALSVRTVLRWLAQSIYQGSVVIISALTLFDESFTYLAIIIYSALLVIEYLNLYTEVHHPSCKFFFCILGSVILYITSLYLLWGMLNLSYINIWFILKIFFIAVLSWLPVHIVSCLVNRFDPSELSKIEGIHEKID